MSVTVHNNIVSGPEECYIPAHLSYGQFLFDQVKNGGDKVALVSKPICYNYNFLNPYITFISKVLPATDDESKSVF